jgi:hypothetical protein
MLPLTRNFLVFVYFCSFASPASFFLPFLLLAFLFYASERWTPPPPSLRRRRGWKMRRRRRRREFAIVR